MMSDKTDVAESSGTNISKWRLDLVKLPIFEVRNELSTHLVTVVRISKHDIATVV